VRDAAAARRLVRHRAGRRRPREPGPARLPHGLRRRADQGLRRPQPGGALPGPGPGAGAERPARHPLAVLARPGPEELAVARAGPHRRLLPAAHRPLRRLPVRDGPAEPLRMARGHRLGSERPAVVWVTAAAALVPAVRDRLRSSVVLLVSLANYLRLGTS